MLTLEERIIFIWDYVCKNYYGVTYDPWPYYTTLNIILYKVDTSYTHWFGEGVFCNIIV